MGHGGLSFSVVSRRHRDGPSREHDTLPAECVATYAYRCNVRTCPCLMDERREEPAVPDLAGHRTSGDPARRRRGCMTGAP
ncbi:hypothetical protein BEI_3261 [Halomonas beimenensis]|uniref:Uncharacterized protein n=1 Tax=Halomonas beimenensis TaxID=475662 RepID=A0A291PBL2_9GAMM|nr:hypothetical protein BEI_3261 [Halomonas beimenensis]